MMHYQYPSTAAYGPPVESVLYGLVQEQSRLVGQLWTEVVQLREDTSRTFASLREDAACLRECLADAGIMTSAQFEARLHRRHFEAMQRLHPWEATARLSEVLHPDGIGKAVGLYAGPNAVEALCGSGRAIAKAVTSIVPTLKHHFPGFIYICGGITVGGIDGAEVLRSVECLKVADGRWHPVAEMLERRRRGAAATMAGRLHICGGVNESGQALNSVERYDPVIGVWELLPSMIECRGRVAVAVVGCRLVVCGGEGGSSGGEVEGLQSVECLDPYTLAWHVLPRMGKCRSDAVAAAIGGYIYVCGGENVKYFMSSVERMACSASGEIIGFSWEAAATMNVTRASAAAATVSGSIYVCGGRGGAVQYLCSCERLAAYQADRWENVGSMAEVRSGATAASVAGRLYVFGGFSNGRYLRSSESFDPVNGLWTPSADLPSPWHRREEDVGIAFAAAAAVAE